MGVLAELSKSRARTQGEALSAVNEAPEALPETPGETVEANALQDLVLRYGGLLPAAGGLAGGIGGAGAGTVFGLGVGGVPGAVGGAALGGAGGEAANQLLRRAVGLEAPESGQEAALGIGRAAGEQGLSELAGVGLARGAQLGGKALLSSALGRRGLQKVDPALVAAREGIGATRGGLAKLVDKIFESDRAARRLVTKGVATRLKYRPFEDVASPAMNEVIENLTKSPVFDEDVVKVQKLTKRFLRDNPGPMTAERLWETKKKADKIAAPIFKKIEEREVVTSSELVTAAWHKAYADRARSLLRDGVPGLQQVEQRTSELIGLKRSVIKSVKGESTIASKLAGRGATGAVAGLAAAAVPGSPSERAQHGVGAAALGAAIANPQVLSMLALALGSPLLAKTLGQVPRAIGASQQ